MEEWVGEGVAVLQASSDGLRESWFEFAPETVYVFALGTWIAFLLPSSAVEILPGFLFGLRKGFFVSLLGKVLGGLISLVLCRLFVRDRVRQYFFDTDRFPRMKAIADALEERDDGTDALAVMVALRMSYAPVVLKNYGLAVLDTSVIDFVLSSVIAGAPYSLLWAAVGNSAQSVQDIVAGKTSAMSALPQDNFTLAAMGFGIICIIAILSVFFRRLSQKVKQKLDEVEKKESMKKRSQKNENEESSIVFTSFNLAVVTTMAGLLGLYIRNRDSLPRLKDVMSAAVEWIESKGEMGPLYYMIFLGVWVAALLPCSILEMVPGLLFGFRTGVVVSIVGKNIGTVISLLLARYVLRDRMQEKLMKRFPYLKALEKAVKSEGFPMIVMIRCAYLPMLLKNYGLGCLDISIFEIWVASLFASLPFASLWTAVGASATNMADIFEGKISVRDILPDNYLLVAGVAAIGASIFLYAFARFMKRFRQIMKEAEEKSD